MRFTRETVGASSASMFLVNDCEPRVLQGVVSEWDWTRTSFPSSLAEWPTVASALETGELRTISSTEAALAEAEWFEARGIARTVCVPLRGDAGPIGVLFFDFDASAACDAAALAALADTGRRCARALTRAATTTTMTTTETACAS